jgi:CRP-like cAMP-binding protein
MDLDTEVRTIRNAPLFQGLCASKTRLLACMSEQQTYEAGEYVCQHGEPSDAAYLILDGEVEFVVDGPAGPVVIGRQAKGSIFGEVGLLCNRDRFASVRATTPLSVMRINKDCLLRMMQDNAEFSMSVARGLADRVLRLAERAGAGSEMAH